MFITRTINGKEHKIELTKDEMIQIANELDIVNLAESVSAYIENIEDNELEEESRVNLQKLNNCPENIKKMFHRLCANEIISRAEEYDIALTNDLTDIFRDTINDALKCFDTWYETEVK